MGLNIKNPEAHKLAAELAELTGTSMTQAVIDALNDRLELKRRESRREREQLVEDLLEIGRQCAAGLKGQPIDHAALLYDEFGLPK